MKRRFTAKLAITSAFGFFIILFLSSSGLALAQGTGIWTNTSCAAQSTTGGPVGPCDFCDAIIVTNNIIQMLFKFSLVIGTLMIVIGGITMIIATGNENTFKKGQKTLIKAVTGVAIALLSWIIVSTVIRFLTGSSAFPWDQISCTHNQQLQPINSAPGLQNSSSTYMKVAGNGNYACSNTGVTWSLSDFSGTFCSNAAIYAGSKSACGKPAVSPEQVWAVQTSSVTFGSSTIYTCYTTQADCEANGSCIQMSTNGAHSGPFGGAEGSW